MANNTYGFTIRNDTLRGGEKMDLFSSYRLIKNDDGYDLELYIDNPAMNDFEFANEFSKIDPDNRQRLDRNIHEYIRDKFPGLRIQLVKVMAGSMLLASFLYAAPVTAQAADTSTVQSQSVYDYSAKVSINGQLQSFDSKPFFYNNTTYVNLYEFGNKIGASVWWNDSSNTVGINKNNIQIAFMRGSTLARVNGEQVTMPKSLVIGGITYAPIKFIAENLGYQVTLDSATNTVMVNNKSAAANNGVYTVVAGDTLWGIAGKHGTTVDNLKRINNLTSNTINIGQKLNLYLTYTVKSGDTLWKISQQYGVSVADIQKTNSLPSDAIYIGQTLIIPGAATVTPTPAPIPTPNPVPVTTWPSVTYIVQPGDTATSISKKFGVFAADIVKYNYMVPNDWFDAGDRIAISGYAPRTYSVTPGQYSTPARKGALVDWVNEGQYLIKRGETFTIVDVDTGKQLHVTMLGGYNHSDVEPVTYGDTDVMKQLFPTWTWSPRAVVIYINGMNIAASLSGMPHSFDTIDNGVNGHFDLYLENSSPHSGDTSAVYVQEHVNMVLKAAGIQ